MNDVPYQAEYHESPILDYRGNPLIEALPPILTETEALQAMGNFPPAVSEEERNLDSSVRLHGVDRLRLVVQPLFVHIALESDFSALIRSGYVSRNPFSSDTVRHLHSLSTTKRLTGNFKSSASTFGLIGLSGVGKSTSLESVLKLYPQTITHRRYKGLNFVQTQITWLKFDCPFDGSLGGLCRAFFRAVDFALGQDRYSKSQGRASIPSMIQLMEQIASTYYLGALIIDELQNLRSAKTGGKDNMLNFFVNLINVIGIPIVVVGNNSMLNLFSDVLRNARRVGGCGITEFQRFERDRLWELFINMLWSSYNWCRSENPLTEEILDTLYDLSQGVTDFAVKLIILGQREAIQSREEVMTPALLRRVFNSRMKILAPALAALRSGDPRQLSRFEDLIPVKDQIDAMMLWSTSSTNDRFALLETMRGLQNQPSEPQPKKQAHAPLKAVIPPKAKEITNDASPGERLLAEGWLTTAVLEFSDIYRASDAPGD
jgi:hypothetical protein